MNWYSICEKNTFFFLVFSILFAQKLPAITLQELKERYASFEIFAFSPPGAAEPAILSDAEKRAQLLLLRVFYTARTDELSNSEPSDERRIAGDLISSPETPLTNQELQEQADYLIGLAAALADKWHLTSFLENIQGGFSVATALWKE